MSTIRIGTRKSMLAMWQTETVAAALEQYGIVTEIRSMETKGDKILDTTIAKIGSKGVFTEELEAQLQSGETDIAVHSAKDMQSHLPQGFELIAFGKREKVNDVLVSDRDDLDLEKREQPFTIGTSSVRRIALLKHFHPHIRTVDMRGNLQTRISKMRRGDCDALMLAYAGVKRMGYADMIVHTFAEESFIPPVGQGCIAVEAATSLSADKRAVIKKAVNDPVSETCLCAERAFLRKLEGGCSIPAFGLARLDGTSLTLTAGLAALDGSTVIERRESGDPVDAEDIGKRVGQYILDHGGRELLARIRSEQGEV